MAIINICTSVGGAAFLEALSRSWAEAGWEVRRHHAIEDHEYRKPRGTFGRLSVRWKMTVGFGWKCWRIARRAPPGSIHVVTTNPFFSPALVQWGCGRSATTVQVLYDLYPDALIQSGLLKPDSHGARMLAAVTRAALRHCSATVFLGERLRAYAEARYGASRRGCIIPVGADGEPFRNLPPQPLQEKEPTTLLYAGQLGRMHEVDTLRQAIVEGLPAGLRMVFHASGAGYRLLRDQLRRAVPGCEWGAPLENERWMTAMRAAHVAIVSISPGAENIVMPSKTYSALVAGQAILAICPRQSDLADLVIYHDCGWVVEPGDVEGLRSVLLKIAQDPEDLLLKRRRAFGCGHSEYDVQVLAKKWTELFRELEMGQAI